MKVAVARLGLRLSPADKRCVARAAALRGVSLSAFVRDAVLREVDGIIAAELTVTLSEAESRRFLEALDAPFRANAKLKKALARVARGWPVRPRTVVSGNGLRRTRS